MHLPLKDRIGSMGIDSSGGKFYQIRFYSYYTKEEYTKMHNEMISEAESLSNSQSIGNSLFLSYSFLIKVASLGKGGHLFCEERKNGGIAQLVEHLPCKQGVIGSNPITSTIMGS